MPCILECLELGPQSLLQLLLQIHLQIHIQILTPPHSSPLLPLQAQELLRALAKPSFSCWRWQRRPPRTPYLGILETLILMARQGAIEHLQNSDLADYLVNLEVAQNAHSDSQISYLVPIPGCSSTLSDQHPGYCARMLLATPRPATWL